MAEMLMDLGHALGAAYSHDQDLLRLVRVRNDLMHQLRAVTPEESGTAVERIRILLTPLHLPPPAERPVI